MPMVVASPPPFPPAEIAHEEQAKPGQEIGCTEEEQLCGLEAHRDRAA